jgi:2-C-methyl-D-erythritol 4-phosphate cytidylyltransferase
MPPRALGGSSAGRVYDDATNPRFDTFAMLSAIIVAGGSSQRMGSDKLFAAIGGEPLIAHAIRAFERSNCVSEIVLVAREQQHDEIKKIASSAKFKKIRAIVPGGERRQDSVRAGLGRIDREAKYVAVHDAARPLITPEQIERTFGQCRVHGAAALAQPVNDTLKRADADLAVIDSVDRHQLYAMQTPQIFDRKLIQDAYQNVYAQNDSVTDEVSAVERLGQQIALVLNDDFNFKITYPRDLPVADFILRERASDRR